MSEAAKLVTPAPMEGHGVYNRSSRVQAAGSSPALPLFEHAARNVELEAPMSGWIHAKLDSTAARCRYCNEKEFLFTIGQKATR